MKKLAVTINNIQHLRKLHFEVDLTSPRLICITGKNGAGKTTLVKALRTLASADTFSKTTAQSAFSKESSISYLIDGQSISFQYDDSLGSIETTDAISDEVRNSVVAELPLPYGERFNFFQRISNADDDIRRAIAIDDYRDPVGLKRFLEQIYQNRKFDRLVEVAIKGSLYYCILLDNLRYIREDYLSSGEYFVIALYRRIATGQKLFIVDEIDISLDAAAQVRLVDSLRTLATAHGVSIIFTTHSVALMRNLKHEELFYIDDSIAEGPRTPTNISFNHINSLLFGFTGWDKYILTEDDMLSGFLEHLIGESKASLFYKYKIIHVGGALNTVDLMQRNAVEKFFADQNDVITVIDGDQRLFRHAKRPNVHLLPFDSIEKAFLAACARGQIAIQVSDFIPSSIAVKEYVQRTGKRLSNKRRNWLARLIDRIKQRFGHGPTRPLKESEFGDIAKSFFRKVTKEKLVIGQKQIFQNLCALHAQELTPLRTALDDFLCAPPVHPSRDQEGTALLSAGVGQASI